MRPENAPETATFRVSGGDDFSDIHAHLLEGVDGRGPKVENVSHWSGMGVALVDAHAEASNQAGESCGHAGGAAAYYCYIDVVGSRSLVLLRWLK